MLFISLLILYCIVALAVAQNRKNKQRIAAVDAKQTARSDALEAEQKRQAEQIAKHEAQLAAIRFRIEQAEADAQHWKEQVNALYALLDAAQLQQAGTIPGGKEDLKCQNKILTLEGKIYAAEKRMRKARFDADQARKLIA